MAQQHSRSPRGETFLVADLVGYGACGPLHSKHDDADAALRRHALGLLEASRGREMSHVGDELRIACADPAAALLLAVRLVQDLSGVRQFPPVRVGVHAASGGPTSLGSVASAIAVPPAEVAARLCAASAGGEVLASEGTLAEGTTGRELAVGPRRLHWMRGVVEPISARPVTARFELEPSGAESR